MSSTSTQVIHLTVYLTGQYPKGLEQSQDEKVLKTTKAIKIVTKARKLRNIAYFPALLLFFYHSPCLSKKPHPDDKNLKRNLLSSFFLPFKPKFQYYFYPP